MSAILYLSFFPRPELVSNRFNATDLEHLQTIGFKTGDENCLKFTEKGTHLFMKEKVRFGLVKVGRMG